MELMPESEWPRIVEAAVDRMLSAMTAKQRELMQETAHANLIRFHDNLGRWIRNQFGLWRGNKELMGACGFLHPDDCSMVIIDACWERLRSEWKRME